LFAIKEVEALINLNSEIIQVNEEKESVKRQLNVINSKHLDTLKKINQLQIERAKILIENTNLEIRTNDLIKSEPI